MSLLDVSELFQTEVAGPKKEPVHARRRSNSQSQTIAPPVLMHPRGSTTSASRNHNSLREHKPLRRQQGEYYVTLVPLNDTFVKKHIHVPYFPETCRLGRPTGTKIKPHVTNGYFDSRVLSRNHACMFIDPKLGQLMIQDMGSSNGTFVNSEKIVAEPVPVNVGDTINLGFNIQLETSHKQISARIDNISVVSNNPKGSVLGYLPLLTKDVIDNFSAAELRHLDFIQGVFALLLPPSEQPEDEAEVDPAVQAQKAFEDAMFADVVPTLDDSLTACSEPFVNAGIFNNSRIINSNDLESTLELLMVNLARVKQQNLTLKSLENFLVNYSSKVTSVNAQLVKSEVAKSEAKFEDSLKAERDKALKSQQDHVRKSDEHRQLVSALENEIIKLRTEHESLLLQIHQKELADDASTDNELSFTNMDSNGISPSAHDDIHNSKDRPLSADVSSFDFGPAKSLKLFSPEASEEIEEISNSSDVESEDHSTEEKRTLEPAQESLNHQSAYVNQIATQFSHYKNQGVVLGLLVVVAGFLYQSSGK